MLTCPSPAFAPTSAGAFRSGGITVRVVELEMVPAMGNATPMVADIVAEPTATGVAKPFDPPALLMDAIVESDELQITEVVRSFVELSEKVPVAVNCCVEPMTVLGFVGVTVIDVSISDVTVRVEIPEMAPAIGRVTGSVAVIVVDPSDNVVAKPVGLHVATLVFDDLHDTRDVTSCVVESEYVPMAVNCSL